MVAENHHIVCIDRNCFSIALLKLIQALNNLVVEPDDFRVLIPRELLREQTGHFRPDTLAISEGRVARFLLENDGLFIWADPVDNDKQVLRVSQEEVATILAKPTFVLDERRRLRVKRIAFRMKQEMGIAGSLRKEDIDWRDVSDYEVFQALFLERKITDEIRQRGRVSFGDSAERSVADWLGQHEEATSFSTFHFISNDVGAKDRIKRSPRQPELVIFVSTPEEFVEFVRHHSYSFNLGDDEYAAIRWQRLEAAIEDWKREPGTRAGKYAKPALLQRKHSIFPGESLDEGRGTRGSR